MNYQKLLQKNVVLSPDILLTPSGVKKEWAVRFDGTKIKELGPKSDFEDVISLPNKAIFQALWMRIRMSVRYLENL